jgi:transposase InsO family protein
MHADGIAAVDLFVLPTVAFQILYCLVILRHGRRFWMSFGVTSNPTAEWISRQITEAFPWDHAPEYLIRDRDRSYGSVFVRRLCAMGIRDRPIAPRSPWQNAYVERLIGTIRRECLDHIIVCGETHLRRIVGAYAAYYNESRTHRSLDKDAPFHRAIQRLSAITSQPVLGELARKGPSVEKHHGGEFRLDPVHWSARYGFAVTLRETRRWITERRGTRK